MMSKSISKKIFVVLISLLLSLSAFSFFGGMQKAKAATTYKVSPAVRYQEIDGWGTSLIWWAGQIGGYTQEGDDGREVRDQIMSLLYSKEGLDYNIARYNVGEHELKIVVGDGWMNIDGAVVQTAADTEYSLPKLKQAVFYDGKLSVEFSGQEADYKVEYKKTNDQSWTQADCTVQPENENYIFKVAEDLTDGTYFVRISSGNYYFETMQVSTIAKGDLLYYVNCDSVDTGVYNVFEKADRNNSVKDKAYGLDLGTNKMWGRTTEGNATYLMGTNGSPYQALGDVVSADGNAD